jgi:serine/threonine protein kinase/class 3 adenylate cyclase/tetratricopeptide (TPR) repeat protein
MAELKTFVFTDIVRSVDLKSEMPGRSDLERDEAFVSSILLPHRQRIERGLAEAGGRVVSTAGDSHFLVFSDTIRAARWAIAVQETHRDDPISTPAGNAVSVRMSMHVGIPQIDPRDPNNFIGKSVDYAARLNDYATGGQILASRSVVAILGDAGMDEVQFHAHGQRELKGIGPIEVHELAYDPAGPRTTRRTPKTFTSRQWTVLPATVGITDFQGPPGDATASTAALTERKLGNYELLELLGSGGMGDVYKARHVQFDRIRTVKVIKQHFVEGGHHEVIRRFYQEIKAVGRLEHPNIVVAIDSSSPSDAIHFLVMEHVDGIGVDRLIEFHGPLAIADACEIARQAARGLQYIYQHGMVHRDVKPSNLMLTLARDEELSSDYPSSEEPGGQRGIVKILDLGLALLVDNDAERLTRFDGRAMGTAMYMAPEQWRTASVDVRADIYSLGCTLYHMLAGKPPFVDSDLRPEKAHERLKLPPIERSDPIPRELWSVLQKMTAKEVDDRFALPTDVATALAPFSQGHDLASLVRRYHPSKPTLKAEATRSATTPASQIGVETAASGGRSSAIRPTQPRRWYSQVVAPLLIALVAAVGAYKLWPPPAEGEPEPYEELIALPGLNGGWWFHEFPDYLPAVRQQLFAAMAAGKTEHGDVDVSALVDEAQKDDASKLYQELVPVIAAFDRSLTPHQQRVGHQLQLLDPYQLGAESYTFEIEQLCDYLDSVTDKTAADWHLLAVLNHDIARWEKADTAYQTALEKYESEHQWPLYALCNYDYGQMLLDFKRYSEATHRFSQARIRAPNPVMKMLSYCQEAQATYRLRNLTQALVLMERAQQVPEIEPQHPLRAYVLERQGWIQLEYWQIVAAEDSFRKAQDIVETQVDEFGNQYIADLYIWAGQGLATAQTFSGRPAEAIATYEGLLEDIDQALAVPSAFWLGRELTPNQRLKLRERRPSIYLRLGDNFLVLNDYQQASDYYQRCIDACLELNWEEADYRAPFVVDWRYIACLPLALQGNLQEAEAQFQVAKKREEELRREGHLPGGADAKPTFTRSVVHAVLGIRSSEASRREQGVADLMSALRSVDANDLGRHHLGLFLLAVEQLAEPSTPTNPEILNNLALIVTQTFHPDSIGRELEIRPYLKAPLTRLQDALQRAADKVGESTTTVNSLKTKIEAISRLLTPPPPRNG